MLQFDPQRGKLRKVTTITDIGRLFAQIRGRRTLRQIEEETGINRETWRSVEIGRIRQPGVEVLMAATQLAAAPTMPEFLRAIQRDIESRVAEKYLPTGNTPTSASV